MLWRKRKKVSGTYKQIKKRVEEGMKKAKIILKEMIIGLFIWSLPVLVILTLAATNKPAVICGVIVGVLSAAGIIFICTNILTLRLTWIRKMRENIH